MSKLTIQCQLVLISTLFLANHVNAQYEGYSCIHKTNGFSGICKRLHKCQIAIQDLRQGIFPQTCGFVGSMAIVCCPKTAITRTTTTTPTQTITTTTTIITPPTTTATLTHNTTNSIESLPGQLLVGQRSRQACEDYKILAYKKEIIPTLSGDEDYEIVENCPWDNDGVTAIYDGEECDEAEFPHMALIGYGTYPDNYEWKCGGSLISDTFVLTAAHCMYHPKIGRPKFVRLGELDFANSSDDKYVQQIDIKTRIKHNLYKSRLRYHDIGLLELAKPAILNLYVKPICLYTLDPAGRENEGIITGWGITEHGKPSNKLLKGHIKYFSAEICNITFRDNTRTLPRGIDSRIQICYGPHENQTDTCEGDSGGPIQIYNKDVYCSYYIFGITSIGNGCGNTNIPAGYVNLYSYIEWIESIVWPSRKTAG